MELEPLNLLDPKFPPEIAPIPSRRRYFFIIAAAAATLFLGWFLLHRLGVASASGTGLSLRPRRGGFLTAVKNFVFPDQSDLAVGASDRLNILLLGMGGPGHEGPFLTDTNIIASLKPSTREAALISIPRDVGAPIKNLGWRRINSANAYGEVAQPGQGGEYARAIFAEIFQVDLPYYVRVDFQAFVEIIDAVGGLTINVPRSFVDEHFPGSNESYQTVSFVSGEETMSGQRALIFARSRHGNNGEDSDFARARRQQLLLTALRDKILSVGTYFNPFRIQSILSSLSSHLTTNMDFGELMYLAGLARDFKMPFKTLVFDDAPGGYLLPTRGEQGAFILAPKTGTFLEMQSAIANIFNDNPPLASASVTSSSVMISRAPIYPLARIEIWNGTWRAGLAARYEQTLKDRGFNVASIGNSPKRPLDKSAVYLLNAKIDGALLAEISTAMQTPFSTILPEWVAGNGSTTPYRADADVLIILGDNAVSS